MRRSFSFQLVIVIPFSHIASVRLFQPAIEIRVSREKNRISFLVIVQKKRTMMRKKMRERETSAQLHRPAMQSSCLMQTPTGFVPYVSY